MADDNSQRAFRPSDYSRSVQRSQGGAHSSGPANDPLAELARLIGQNDPFAEFGRKAPASAAPQQQHAQHQDWAPQPYAAPVAEPQPAAYDQPAAGYDSNAYYADDGYDEAEREYDDVPSRRRWKVLAVAAVVGLAVVGTAGAVGYRALFGSTGSTPPPVIKAETTPTKVVPPSKSDAQSNKMIYDRVGERGSGEKLVSREEQPIDIAKSPPPNGMMSSAGPATASIAPADQPKKIHTIVIRPDQVQAAAEPPAPPPRAAATPSPAPTPRAPAPRAAAPQRLASAPPVATADAEEAAPVPRPAPPAQHAAASRNAPLSLTPGAQAAPRPEPVRTASAPATQRPAPAAAASGQYAVQVSSQRSEAEAQAAFRNLQAKYPSQLGGRAPIIRRADLGSKGVYYRAMVGPFASSGDASSLCQSLKAAGGSCLIQKN